MTQLFDEKGTAHAVTVVKILPGLVTQVKNVENDGYTAVQFGFGVQKEHRIAKPQKGHAKGLGNFEGFIEFDSEGKEYKVGDAIDVTQFVVGDTITVSATSKGKGFQGVVKRHGFGGGPRTHGQKHSEREPGSIGGGLRNRVPKGMRMAGRMGGDRITVQNLSVMYIDTAKQEVYVRGAVPGRRGSLVEIIG